MKRWFPAKIVALVSALALAGLAAPRSYLPSPAHSQAVAGSLPDDRRSMPVDEASDAIVRATLSGPRFHAPELIAAVEDYHNPRLKRLRDEYGLEKVTAGEPSEFRKLLKLRHWVHTRWPIDNDQKEGGDAFAILEKAKTGAGFHCSHSLTVQHAVMVAMGYVVRDLGVDRSHQDLGRSAHHGVNEVWSNDQAKWVLLDAKYDIHFERDGAPLSAMELHEAVRADGGKGIVKVQGIKRRPVPMDTPDAPEATVRGYWWVSYYLRPAPFTIPHWSGGSRLLVLDNDAFRNVTWYRGGRDEKLVKHWAYGAQAFVPARERHEIEWTPGVPDLRARQVAPAELEVAFRSATPNFDTYLARLDNGSWKPVPGDRMRWPLRTGENRLEIRTRNLAGIVGPVVSAAIEFKPGKTTAH
ncbi:MAG: transglutaminase domain-containing protein [Acidobacteria bacterium]|nr:transglutaminase domain-containing protein [Acidobacteriota bacterium]